MSNCKPEIYWVVFHGLLIPLYVKIYCSDYCGESVGGAFTTRQFQRKENKWQHSGTRQELNNVFVQILILLEIILSS